MAASPDPCSTAHRRRPGPSRRAFLRGLAGTAAGLLLRPAWGAAAEAMVSSRRSADTPSTVAMVRAERMIQGIRVRATLLREAIDQAVCLLAGRQDPAGAWGTFVRPGERVLLKFTWAGAAALGTARPVLEALVESLEAAGHERSAIAAADCDDAASVPGLRPCAPGWSQRTATLGDPPEAQQVRRYLDDVDAIVNVPFLTDHNLAGVACAMMNVSLPMIRRPGPYFGPDRIHEAIVDLSAAPEAGGLVRLTLVNALRCVHQGGPAVDASHVFFDNGIWASTDMVAVDRLAQEWIDRHRRSAGLPTLEASGRPPRYLAVASERRMGQADPRWIERRTAVL